MTATAPGVEQIEGVTLSRDLADFLIELSIALNKYATYPAGHPLVEATVARLARRLAPLLVPRAALAIGVGQGQLLIEGAATDTRTAVLHDLAERLRRCDIGALHLRKGITVDELAMLLGVIGEALSKRSGTPSDSSRHASPNAEIVPLDYQRLAMGPRAQTDASPLMTRVTQLWIELARTAVGPQGNAGASDPELADPLVVAREIERRAGTPDYDATVVAYLRQIASELRRDEGTESLAVRARIASLIGGLGPQALQRLVSMRGEEHALRAFLLDASHWLAADAVVEIVRAAAGGPDRPASDSMLRLLQKFALHVQRSGGATAEVAEGELRERVRRLVSEWTLEDPSPSDYRSALADVGAHVSVSTALDGQASAVDPARIVMMRVELASLDDSCEDDLICAGDIDGLASLADIASRAPDAGASEWLWSRIGTVENLRLLLSTPPVNLDLLQLLVGRMGLDAAEPLLDTLEWMEHRPTRRRLLELLAQLGPAVGPLLAARLEGAPWFVQRNLLLVLGKLPEWPPSFSPDAYAAHEDARVRRVAVKMLLSHGPMREQGIRAGLADQDEQVLRLALSAALADCPPDCGALLLRRLEAGRLPLDLRTLAARALAACGTPEALDWMVELALVPHTWYRRARLSAKSAELLGALAGMAAHWSNDERAAKVLEHAARSRDEEIRAAAAGKAA